MAIKRRVMRVRIFRNNIGSCIEFAERYRYPIVVKPFPTLNERGKGIAHQVTDVLVLVEKAEKLSPNGEVKLVKVEDFVY